jgi:hypothetical protein
MGKRESVTMMWRGSSGIGLGRVKRRKMLDRDRTSYSFKAAFGAPTQGSFNFEIEPENIILVALRLFEFSHRLGPEPKSTL